MPIRTGTLSDRLSCLSQQSSESFILPPAADISTLNHMNDQPDDTVTSPLGKNNHEAIIDGKGDPDAFGTVDETIGDRDGVQDLAATASQSVPNATSIALSARDEALLRHVVLLRLLTYSQIHRLLFSSTDPSFSRRRIRALTRAGWLSMWEPASPTGGHVRYAHPTQRTLRRILPAFETSHTPWAKIVSLMLPRTKRRPLQLTEATIPKWLAHQREVNHLVASITTAPGRRILWASSWDSPFPPRLGMFAAPQPDYVIVEEVDGEPELVFGEHDRASESIDRFIARKIALYSALAKFPEACEQHFGVRRFRVQITAIDPYRRAPIQRMRELIDATRRHGGPDVYRFTLGGWLFAYPNDPIWFSTAQIPSTASVALTDHHVGTDFEPRQCAAPTFP